MHLLLTYQIYICSFFLPITVPNKIGRSSDSFPVKSAYSSVFCQSEFPARVFGYYFCLRTFGSCTLHQMLKKHGKSQHSIQLPHCSAWHVSRVLGLSAKRRPPCLHLHWPTTISVYQHQRNSSHCPLGNNFSLHEGLLSVGSAH